MKKKTQAKPLEKIAKGDSKKFEMNTMAGPLGRVSLAWRL
jgi:hypothetical protein